MTRDQRILGWRLVLLPFLLLLMALWQGHRAESTRNEALALQSTLHSVVLTTQQLQAQNSHEDIQLGDRRVSPALAEALAQRQLTHVDHDVLVARVGGWLPGISTAFSALLLLFGAASLLALRVASEAALKSRDRLVKLFYVGRKVLPTLLVAMLLLLTLTVVLEVAYEALWLFTLDQASTAVMKLQLLVGSIMLIMLWPLYRLPRQLKAMTQLFTLEPRVIFGTALTEAQAPILWERVRALAGQFEALVPDHIAVGYLDGFYVISSEVELAPSGQRLQGRTLYLPLPLLAVLDANETRAVIGHELAHFSGQDTDYGLRFVPIYDGAWRSVRVLGERMEGGLLQSLLTLPAYGLAMHFMQSFDRAVSHWSRSTELRADAASAVPVGAQVAVDALVRVSAVAPLIDALLDDWCHAPESWPQDVLQALLVQLAEQPLALPEGELDDEPAHPTDSHPPTLRRIQAMGLGLDAVHNGRGLRPVVPAQAMACLEQLLPGAAVLARHLSTELGQRLLDNHEELRQDLQARVEAVQGRCELHEGAQVRGRVVIAISVLMVLGGLTLALGPMASAVKSALVVFYGVLAASLAILGLVFAALGWRLLKRAATPALILDAQTMRFHNAPEPLPLHHIAGYRLMTGTATAVQLLLDEDAPLPLFHTPSFWQPDAKFTPKNRLIVLQLTRWSINGKALKPQALSELVGKYLEGAHAHQALTQMQARKTGAETDQADAGQLS
ncbi:M48 family metallopeptidase [Pseudomonas sp.]|uniref:M48 family metallopeptidase n=1 Tax=Pseudomonas sp. TaxID=306 RepID=UPI0028A6CBDF|nr:M48 family metallopeptidase [Pseudomonas sp.]